MRGGTAPERSRTGALVALLATPWLLACAQIAGTTDYRVGAASEKSEPPTPFLAGSAECEACAASKCEKELAACAADQVCSDWLADIRARPDPLSGYERYQTEIEQVWQTDHDGKPANESIPDLRACAAQCLEPCKGGQNFSCVGDFDWDLPKPAVLHTRATQSGIPVRAQISACSSSDLCETPLASQATDNSGFAELDFTQGAQARAAAAYLNFVRPNDPPWQWVQTRPLADGNYVPLDFISTTSFTQWHESFGQSFDSGQGVLIVVPFDCSGVNAKQVTVEAWVYQKTKLTFCSDCFYAYSQDMTEQPDKEQQGYVTTGRAGYIARVPPGMTYVVLRRLREPHDIVSVASLVVQGGGVATVRAYPSSHEQRLAFPDPRN